jgi:hypothetical protein
VIALKESEEKVEAKMEGSKGLAAKSPKKKRDAEVVKSPTKERKVVPRKSPRLSSLGAAE